MRWLLALILVTCVGACRRSAPAPSEELQAEATAEVAVGPTVSPEEPPVAAAPPAPSAAEPSLPQPAVTDPAPAPETSEAASPFDEEGAIFRWTDAQGATHYGSGADVPDDRRATARKVSGGVTVVEPGPTIAPMLPPAATASAVSADAAPAEAAPAPSEPGDEPELDADGLPIPGTMKNTAHTRAIRQTTGVQLDPAAVERRYQQQLRDMKCVEKDGAIVCG